MTEQFVTIVRRRLVMEEVVLTKEEFDKINTFDPNDDDAYLNAHHKFYELPYIPWGHNGDQDFEDPYMVFAGDVTDASDDLVSLSSDWQGDYPLVVDTDSYLDKLFRQASRH